MTAPATVPAMISRAAKIGQELRRIAGDQQLHRLSRQAWQRETLAMGGFAAVADLQAVQAKLATLPYLGAEISLLAERWMRGAQDRPAVAAIFGEGHGDMAAPYAERLTAGISPAEAAAVACWIVAERAPSGFWGQLDSFAELDAMVTPLRAELVELDGALAERLAVRDLAWSEAGKPALALPDGRQLLVESEVVSRLATAITELPALLVPPARPQLVA